MYVTFFTPLGGGPSPPLVRGAKRVVRLWYLRRFLRSNNAKCCKLQRFMRCLCTILQRILLVHVLCILPQETSLQIKNGEIFTKMTFLHTEDFLQRNLYSKELLHTNVLELLHTKIITQKNFYIASFNIQMWVCTRKLLHTENSLYKCREVALSVEIEIAESGHLRPLAGSGHLRPLAGSGHLRPLVGSGHLRPLAGSGHLRPLVGRGHLRPPVATRWERPLAATRSELSGAATCGHSLGAATCGHLERPLAATCGHSSGCK